MRSWIRFVTAIALCLCAVDARAASLFDPALRFRAVKTEHFVIYFHQGEDRLAARLMSIAEETWRALVRPFGIVPPRLTHVVIADQAELSNGYATPFPRNTIVIYAAWPAGSDFLKTDDWLRLVFTHEFTHIVHLDRSEGWAGVVRGIFGRMPLAFPNTFLPTWQIEGLATWEESAITGMGRLEAGDFRAVVTEAARSNRLEPMDRVNGGLTDWPAGLGPYAYGLGFHAYLASRYGPDTFAALAQHMAGSLPYFGSFAYERVYGKPLEALWRDYQDSLKTAAAAESRTESPTRQRLTHQGFVVAGPRFLPSRCPTCPVEIAYSVRNLDQFPAMYSLALDGSAPHRIASRYLGSTMGVGRDTLYFDQQDITRESSVLSDLYAIDRRSHDVRRLTSGARLVDPDLSPDGRTIVAARNLPGQRDLVLMRVGDRSSEGTPEITTLLSEPEQQFNAPRWSPDGRTIAAERHRPGGQTDIVLIEVATKDVRVVASDPLARWATPAWRPDGRAIIAAAELDDEPFNLYEIDLAASTARRLTHETGGATWPDMPADGHAIVYVGYTADGFDLFRMTYPAGAADDETLRPALRASAGTRQPDLAAGSTVAAKSYSPWTTLRPTSWSPVLSTGNDQLRVGAATTASDVLGYHTVAASATWGLTRPDGAPAIGRTRPDWIASYGYTRWRPIPFLAASRETSFFAGQTPDTGPTPIGVSHERLIETGVVFPITHVRSAERARVSVLRSVDDFALAGETSSLNRSSARLSWSAATAHLFGNSISFERGAAMGVTTELVRRSLGANADATTVTADTRFYLPGLGQHHVFAVRIAGGATTGDSHVGRAFLLGGPGPNAAVTSFGSDAITLLRGFDANTFAGLHVAAMNVEYRLPLARIERGVGVLPVFLHTVHVSAFMDAGNVWNKTFSSRNLKTSLGAELSADVVAGYFYPFTAAIGAAWGHDASHKLADRATFYFRIGRAF